MPGNPEVLCSGSVWEAFFKGVMVQEYLELVRYVLENGAKKTDRTGTGTLSLFGLQTRYDLRKGFPLLTTKKVLFDAVVRELLWFLRGSTNIHDGLTQYTPIWNLGGRTGELGPIMAINGVSGPSIPWTSAQDSTSRGTLISCSRLSTPSNTIPIRVVSLSVPGTSLILTRWPCRPVIS